MKTKTLSAAIAVSGLMAVSGTVLADANDAYRRIFNGDSGGLPMQVESMGKAAYGSVTTMPFAGPKGGVLILTESGLALWTATASTESAMGKAAFGSGAEAGHDRYHRAFYGD